jgi:hypothetical protein
MLQAFASAGSPVGLFSNKKSQFWSILEVFAIKDAAIFYGHLVNFSCPLIYFVAVFVAYFVIWYNFPGFGILHHEKSGNPEPQ